MVGTPTESSEQQISPAPRALIAQRIEGQWPLLSSVGFWVRIPDVPTFMNRQYYQEEYKKLKPGWQDGQAMYCAIVDSLIEKDTKILDIGCGYRNVMKTAYSKTNKTYGIDPNKKALAKNKIIKNKIVCQAENLPFPDNFFDLVVSAWVLEHLENPSVVFKEIYRVLKPRGKVIFLTPNAWNYTIWMIRMTPAKFHAFFARKLYGIQKHDIFPKFYKINSVKRINQTLKPIGFKKVKLYLNGDPTYISFNNFFFKLACFLEDLFDKFPSARVHLIGIYEK